MVQMLAFDVMCIVVYLIIIFVFRSVISQSTYTFADQSGSDSCDCE